MNTRLALGTVQFGLNFGISNKTGQAPQHDIVKLLNKSRLSGVNVLDTAISYGESEKFLGVNVCCRGCKSRLDEKWEQNPCASS